MEGLALLAAAPALLATLAGLALVDSTSIGTLGLPVFMLAQSRVRAAVVVVFLGTIAAFYWVLGLVLLAAAGGGLRFLEGAGNSRVVDVVQLILGVGLFVASFWFDQKHARKRQERRERLGRTSPVQRWKDRLTGPHATAGTAVATAVGAGLIEAASMLPYLGAIGMLTANGIGVAPGAVVLAAYCLLMVLPALVLLVVRMAAARWVEPLLVRINGWFEKRSAEMLGWILGIVGFLVARDALGRLQAADAFGGLL
ncbi:GAP family protein [Myceligenerans crystallogenes]|uniref:GAP family protein n=1 Tax=Myceligenerans crystallogenes TaxID=316335 RepID=A0ABN2N517_9MICO